jgi:hypothetical protein
VASPPLISGPVPTIFNMIDEIGPVGRLNHREPGHDLGGLGRCGPILLLDTAAQQAGLLDSSARETAASCRRIFAM